MSCCHSVTRRVFESAKCDKCVRLVAGLGPDPLGELKHVWTHAAA